MEALRPRYRRSRHGEGGHRAAAFGLVAAVACLALGTACGSSGTITPIVDPPSAYAYCSKVTPESADQFAVCESYRAGRGTGALLGESTAAVHIKEETRGGYRLRTSVSLALGGLAGLLGGTLLGAWLVARLKRRKAIPHGQHVFDQLVGQADAVRRMSHGKPGEPADAVIASAVQRLSLAVAEVERHGRALLERCAGLETEPRKDAVEDAHLQGLYHKLDGLVILVSRIRIRVDLWIEHRSAPDDAAVEAEVTQVLAELGEAEKELAA